MYPRSFDYVAPASIDEAVAALKRACRQGVVGRDEPASVDEAAAAVARWWSTSGESPASTRSSDNGDHVAIGALVRHHHASHPLITEPPRRCPRLLRWTGDVQVRNRGTTVGRWSTAT